VVIRYQPDFPNKLNGVDFQTLEDDPAWFTFAEANHGEPDISERFPVGTHIADAMSESFRDFYLNLHKEILKKEEVWEHYRRPNGLMTQCSYCRRFQRSTAPAA